MFLFRKQNPTSSTVSAGKELSIIIIDKKLFASGLLNKKSSFTPLLPELDFTFVATYGLQAYAVTTDNILFDLNLKSPIAKNVVKVYPHETKLFYIDLNGIPFVKGDFTSYSPNFKQLPFKDVIKISTSTDHTLFLHKNGAISSSLFDIPKRHFDILASPLSSSSHWGNTSAPDFPKGHYLASNHNSVAVFTKSLLHLRGSSAQGSLGLPKGHYQDFQTLKFKDLLEVSLGYSHSIIKTKTHILVSGSNRRGELGLGDHNPRFTFTLI